MAEETLWFCERQFVRAFLEPLLCYIRMGVGFGILPYGEMMSPHSSCLTCCLVGEYLFLSQTHRVLLHSAFPCHTAAGQLHCCIWPPWRRDKVLLLQHKRNMRRLIALHCIPGGTHELPSTEANSVSSVCKCLTLFVCVCVLSTLIPI